MAIRHALWIPLTATALSLSGCASVFRAVFARHPQPVMARAVAPTPVGNPLTDAGRAHLAAGETGLAIEAFQHALGSGEDAAPALNGLAVAYARLERFETAQRLFAEAMAIAPDNQLYAANMARLLRSPALAMRHDGDIAATLTAPAAPPVPAAAPERGQLVRVSANEFHITTVEPSPLPAVVRSPARQTAMARKARVKMALQTAPAPRAIGAAAGSSPEAVRAPGPMTITNPFAAQAQAPRAPANAAPSPSAPMMKVEFRTSQAEAPAEATTSVEAHP